MLDTLKLNIMSETTIKDAITPTLVRNIFENHVIGDDKGWCITVCGKILTVNGKVFFESRTKAVKAFYNSYSWRVKRSIHYAVNPSSEGYGWWRNDAGRQYWNVFKDVLTEEYGLKFIKV
jgi:hypothetical protein